MAKMTDIQADRRLWHGYFGVIADPTRRNVRDEISLIPQESAPEMTMKDVAAAEASSSPRLSNAQDARRPSCSIDGMRDASHTIFGAGDTPNRDCIRAAVMHGLRFRARR
jgi:hypothetical protein